MKRFLLLIFLTAGFASCESVRLTNPDGTQNQPWSNPEGWEQTGANAGPFGPGSFPQSR